MRISQCSRRPGSYHAVIKRDSRSVAEAMVEDVTMPGYDLLALIRPFEIVKLLGPVALQQIVGGGN